MELMTVADATAMVNAILGYFTANWAAIAILVGFGVGLKLFRSFVNRGLRGRL